MAGIFNGKTVGLKAAISGGGSGGGGTDILVVTVTGDSDTGYTADKTFAEITAAYPHVILIWDNAVYADSELSDTQVQFYDSTGSIQKNALLLNHFVIHSDNTVTKAQVDSTWYKRTEIDSKLAEYAKTANVPSKTSQLTNDSGFLTSHQDISGKQDKSTLETDVAAKGFTKNTGTYSKPSTGIPKTDLASDVQTSLGKADSALQSYTETDPTVPAWAKADTKPTYTAEEVGALPITGGTLAGNLSIESGHTLSVADAVEFHAYNSTSKASLSLGGHYENGAGYLQEVELRNLATPTTDLSAANKAYVDAQVASAVTSGVLKYSRTSGFVNQSLSIGWWELGSDVSFTTFTGIFGNQMPYDITVEDPEEGVHTKLVMDCWDVDAIYGHFFVNNEMRFFTATASNGIKEVTK